MKEILEFLQSYRGRQLKLMEVCGTHTAEINRNGIPGLLPPSIQLVSGPGCPVCVTVTAYIDRLIQLGKEPGNIVVTFGDMLRVPGSRQSLSEAKAQGCQVRMVYSPMDMLKLAGEDREHIYIFAAVGFETTTPVYAMLLKKVLENGITNIRLLTSLKVMPPVIDWICKEKRESGIDGFLAPGHVSVITGSRIFEGLSEKYGIPFVVAGFEGEQILAAIGALVKLRGMGKTVNLYTSAVTREGNRIAQKAVEDYFEPADASWRGMGVIPGSGMVLRKKYEAFDAGSRGLMEDQEKNKGCCCARVLTGKLRPDQCPLFDKACTPQNPQGACMVSTEGSCFNSFNSFRGLETGE